MMASPEPWTLKRLAWAYGCSQKGSSEEASLRRDLEERILAEAHEANNKEDTNEPSPHP